MVVDVCVRARRGCCWWWWYGGWWLAAWLVREQDIWDVSKVLKVGSCQASCASSLDWSPDSAYLLAAVLSPKIRVDNGYAPLPTAPHARALLSLSHALAGRWWWLVVGK
jgi:hypothetical protein